MTDEWVGLARYSIAKGYRATSGRRRRSVVFERVFLASTPKEAMTIFLTACPILPEGWYPEPLYVVPRSRVYTDDILPLTQGMTPTFPSLVKEDEKPRMPATIDRLPVQIPTTAAVKPSVDADLTLKEQQPTATVPKLSKKKGPSKKKLGNKRISYTSLMSHSTWGRKHGGATRQITHRDN